MGPAQSTWSARPEKTAGRCLQGGSALSDPQCHPHGRSPYPRILAVAMAATSKLVLDLGEIYPPSLRAPMAFRVNPYRRSVMKPLQNMRSKIALVVLVRSEERRVGKEWGS